MTTRTAGRVNWGWALAAALFCQSFAACDADERSGVCSDCGTGTGSGGAPATFGGSGADSGAFSGLAGAPIEPPPGGAAGEPSGGTGGTGGTVPACRAAADCDDGDACTQDVCDASGVCGHRAQADGSACDDGSPCTAHDSCRDGLCSGEPQTSELALLASAFGYGSELSGTVEQSGGLSAFLDDERVVFADRVDGSGTLLSVVRRRAGELEVEAQGITRVALVRQPYSGWTWQSHWVTHLVALSPARFALMELHRVLRVFEVSGSTIREVSNYPFPGSHAGPMLDAVATADGQIFACADGVIARYRLNAAGEVQSLPAVTLASGSTACLSLGVAADGQTVYASTTQGIARWVASDADQLLAELVLPSVTGLALSANDEQVLVHRVGKLDAFGPAELYRLSDGSLLSAGQQSKDELPFGVGLLSGEPLTAWQRHSGAAQSQALRWGALSGAGALSWPLRLRPDALEDWSSNYERLAVRGRSVLLQPWRRWLELNSAVPEFREITGPGHGAITALVGGRGEQAFALGPYAQQTLGLEPSDTLRFVAGGWRSAADAVSPLQLALPTRASLPTSFDAFTPLFVQPASSVTATLFDPRGSQLENLGNLSLAGGPGLLLTRGASLFQLSRTTGSVGLRQYALAAGLAGKKEPPRPELELELDWESAASTTIGMAADIDVIAKEAVFVELLNDAEGTRRLLWVGFGEGSLVVLARAELDATGFVPQPALRSGKLLLFERERAIVYTAGDGALVQVGAEAVPGEVVQSVLGVDGAERAYVAAVTKEGREELLVVDFEAQLRSRLTLPARAVSLLPLADTLLVATKASVHRLSPSCGSASPAPSEAWPVIDVTNDAAEPTTCEPLPACQAWSAPEVPGDVNRDGCVDADDIALETECYGTPTDVCTESILADLNGNGVVDDYLTVIQNLGQGCPAP